MTEEEWVRAEEIPILVAVSQLSPRRQRLLAVALVRSLRWATGDVVATALDASERFADTGKTKAALKRARDALQNARLELGDPHVDPVAWNAINGGTYLALWTASVACSENAVGGTVREAARALREGDGLSLAGARGVLYPVFREIAGPTPVAFAPEWRTDTALSLARQMYESHDFSGIPILADALQDAGCGSDDVLSHCRDTSLTHVRGCWVIDLVLGKQ